MMAAGQRAGLLVSALLLYLFGTNHGLAEPASINTGILYLKEQRERPPTLSNRETPPEDQGLVGAQLVSRTTTPPENSWATITAWRWRSLKILPKAWLPSINGWRTALD